MAVCKRAPKVQWDENFGDHRCGSVSPALIFPCFLLEASASGFVFLSGGGQARIDPGHRNRDVPETL